MASEAWNKLVVTCAKESHPHINELKSQLTNLQRGVFNCT